MSICNRLSHRENIQKRMWDLVLGNVLGTVRPANHYFVLLQSSFKKKKSSFNNKTKEGHDMKHPIISGFLGIPRAYIKMCQ